MLHFFGEKNWYILEDKCSQAGLFNIAGTSIVAYIFLGERAI